MIQYGISSNSDSKLVHVDIHCAIYVRGSSTFQRQRHDGPSKIRAVHHGFSRDKWDGPRIDISLGSPVHARDDGM